MAGIYTVCLAALSFLIYGTLFVRAYTPSEGEMQQPVAAIDDDSKNISSSDSITYKTWPEGKKKATVLLDAGHGGYDGGNVADDGVTAEKDINLAITTKIAKYLKDLNPNIEVKMTREDDSADWAVDELSDLNYRLDQQKAQNADYFFSIHANSYAEDPTVEGVVFFVNPTDTVMKELTQKMQENMESINWADYYNTIDYQKLQLVTMSDIHSTLIELGYMTNPEDLAHLTSETEQDKIAKAIAAAISDYIMENPDAPKYEKPEEEKSFESSLAAEMSAQSAVDSAAAKHQAEQNAQHSEQSSDPNAPADPNTAADPNADPNAAQPAQ